MLETTVQAGLDRMFGDAHSIASLAIDRIALLSGQGIEVAAHTRQQGQQLGLRGLVAAGKHRC